MGVFSRASYVVTGGREADFTSRSWFVGEAGGSVRVDQSSGQRASARIGKARRKMRSLTMISMSAGVMRKTPREQKRIVRRWR